MTATKTNKIDEITEQLEQGVKNVFESAEYKAYLEFVSKFYDYSMSRRAKRALKSLLRVRTKSRKRARTRTETRPKKKSSASIER